LEYAEYGNGIGIYIFCVLLLDYLSGKKNNINILYGEVL